MVKYTKKHFIARANMVRSLKSPTVRTQLTSASIREFKADNPRFNEKTFRAFIKRKK